MGKNCFNIWRKQGEISWQDWPYKKLLRNLTLIFGISLSSGIPTLSRACLVPTLRFKTPYASVSLCNTPCTNILHFFFLHQKLIFLYSFFSCLLFHFARAKQCAKSIVIWLIHLSSICSIQHDTLEGKLTVKFQAVQLPHRGETSYSTQPAVAPFPSGKPKMLLLRSTYKVSFRGHADEDKVISDSHFLSFRPLFGSRMYGPPAGFSYMKVLWVSLCVPESSDPILSHISSWWHTFPFSPSLCFNFYLPITSPVV